MRSMNLHKKKILFLCIIIVSMGIYSLSFRRTSVDFGRNSVSTIHRHYNATPLLPSRCPWRLIYARPSRGGRFGNRLIEYASAWAVARQHNLTAVVSDGIASALEPSFEGLSLVSKSKYIESLRLKDDLCARWVELQLEKAPIGKNDDDVKKLLSQQPSTQKPISIRPLIVLEQFIVPVRKVFQQHMRLHQTLSEYVRAVFQNVSKSLQKMQAKITFVGIHVRLTDYPRHFTSRFGKNARPVDVNYYLHATDYMIDQLKRRNASNIVFLVVSDDQKWCTSNLIPALEKLLSSKHWTRGDLFVRWSGSSSYRQDFALLSSCNHSIIAYGTYGGGAALLAGGMTVVYDINRGIGGFTNGSAMRFQALIPEWTLLY